MDAPPAERLVLASRALLAAHADLARAVTERDAALLAALGDGVPRRGVGPWARTVLASAGLGAQVPQLGLSDGNVRLVLDRCRR